MHLNQNRLRCSSLLRSLFFSLTLLTLLATTHSQILPSLPDVPAASPSPLPSSSPSTSATSSTSPSPSPVLSSSPSPLTSPAAPLLQPSSSPIASSTSPGFIPVINPPGPPAQPASDIAEAPILILPVRPSLQPDPSQNFPGQLPVAPAPAPPPGGKRPKRTPAPAVIAPPGLEANSPSATSEIAYTTSTPVTEDDTSSGEAFEISPTPFPSPSTEVVITPSPETEVESSYATDVATPLSPTPESTANNTKGSVCIRDTRKVTPILGSSPARTAISIVATAAAIGVVSVLYSLAAKWDINVPHSVLRFVWIVLARILTIMAVKVSAALVVATTSASSDSSAFDASSAYLTWVSAVYSRVYYEALRMTSSVIGFSRCGASAWDFVLRDFITGRDSRQKDIDNDMMSEVLALQEDTMTVEGSYGSSYRNDKFLGYVSHGKLVKILLIVSAILYIIHETANLTISLLNFIQSLSDGMQSSLFVGESEGGQCGIRRQDLNVLIPIALLQLTHSLFLQPSLVPILIFGAFYPSKTLRHHVQNSHKYRYFSVAILAMWVMSVAIMPVYRRRLESLFLVGDLSLFFFVLIAPPSYSSMTYIISIVYAAFTALAGIAIIISVSRLPRRTNSEFVLTSISEQKMLGRSECGDSFMDVYGSNARLRMPSLLET